MTDPDYVFDRHPVREYWWDFLDEAEPEAGDMIGVETETHEWKSLMKVIEIGRERDVIFESIRGKKYRICISQVHHLEPSKPCVRTEDGFNSRGVIDRVEVYTDD